MEKRAAFVANKYYDDDGFTDVCERLQTAFAARGVTLVYERGLYAAIPAIRPPYDFAVFWDKDAALARNLELSGLPVFDSARTIELCDDKEQTFSALSGHIDLPTTVFAPLVYDVSDGSDRALLAEVERKLGYPVIVKACVGSGGRQVFAAPDAAALAKHHRRLMHTPHLFQRYIRADEAGTDTRVYIVGEQAVGCAERRNTVDFRSNTACGGVLRRCRLDDALRTTAEKVARILGLAYGSVDFMRERGDYVFIEANTSPYMKRAEEAGIPLAERYAAYLCEAVYRR